MKKVLIAIMVIVLFAGCGVQTKEGTIILPYPKPLDFSHFEIFVGLAPGFTVTGWSGTAWTGSPNDPATWNGTTNTLKIISATEPIMITGLTPGVTYYVRVVAVDTSYNRSAPSVEYSGVAGGPPLAATLIVAASNASPASKAGADYVCIGENDQVQIQAALDAVAAVVGGSVVLTEGTFILSNKIDIPIDITLKGQGPSTIIKLMDNFSSCDAMIYTSHSSVIKDAALDGNKANVAINVHGIRTEIADDTDVVVSGLTIKNFTNAGILFALGDRPLIDRCTIFNNRVGILLHMANEATFANCYVYENTEIGIKASGGTGGIISNSHVCNNGRHGIAISDYYGATSWKVSINYMEGNGTSADNTYSNLIVLNESAEIHLENNTCRKGAGANKSKYGIRVETVSCSRTLITSNDCYTGGVTAGISNAGTNTSFGAGNRVNDGTWIVGPG